LACRKNKGGEGFYLKQKTADPGEPIHPTFSQSVVSVWQWSKTTARKSRVGLSIFPGTCLNPGQKNWTDGWGGGQPPALGSPAYVPTGPLFDCLHDAPRVKLVDNCRRGCAFWFQNCAGGRFDHRSPAPFSKTENSRVIAWERKKIDRGPNSPTIIHELVGNRLRCALGPGLEGRKVIPWGGYRDSARPGLGWSFDADVLTHRRMQMAFPLGAAGAKKGILGPHFRNPDPSIKGIDRPGKVRGSRLRQILPPGKLGGSSI